MAIVKKLKKYESSHLVINKNTSIYKTPLEPFSFNLRKYIVDFVSLKFYMFHFWEKIIKDMFSTYFSE